MVYDLNAHLIVVQALNVMNLYGPCSLNGAFGFRVALIVHVKDALVLPPECVDESLD